MSKFSLRVMLIGLMIVIVALVLTACGSSYDMNSVKTVDSGTGTTSSVMVDTVDGRTIPCVVWWWGQAGGISCDWSAK